MRGLSSQGALSNEDKAFLLELELSPRHMSASEVLWLENTSDVRIGCRANVGAALSTAKRLERTAVTQVLFARVAAR